VWSVSKLVVGPASIPRFRTASGCVATGCMVRPPVLTRPRCWDGGQLPPNASVAVAAATVAGDQEQGICEQWGPGYFPQTCGVQIGPARPTAAVRCGGGGVVSPAARRFSGPGSESPGVVPRSTFPQGVLGSADCTRLAAIGRSSAGPPSYHGYSENTHPIVFLRVAQHACVP